MDMPTPKKARFIGFKIRDEDDVLIETMIFAHQAVLWTSGSYAEIGAMLGIEKIGTVKSRIHRARAELVARWVGETQ